MINYAWTCSCGETIGANHEEEHWALSRFSERVTDHVVRRCPRRERTVDPREILEVVLEFRSPERCDEPLMGAAQECGSSHFRVVRRGTELALECRGCGKRHVSFRDHLAVLEHVRRQWTGWTGLEGEEDRSSPG